MKMKMKSWMKTKSKCKFILSRPRRKTVSEYRDVIVGKIYDAIELNIASYVDPNGEDFSDEDEDEDEGKGEDLEAKNEAEEDEKGQEMEVKKEEDFDEEIYKDL